jgi:ComF family protein
VLCHGRGQRPVLDLCAACEADLPVQPDACPRCALPAESGSAFSECVRCRADPPPYDRCHAAFRYGFPLDGLVQGLKYDGQLAMSRVLGTLLGRSVQRAALHLDVDALIAVPLHPDKLTERGFNQSIELARWVARAVQRPCEHAWLTRARATRPQVGLPLAERLANLEGAFAATGAVLNRRVVIVDDVVTTGGTARECAWALRRAGASSVDVWCVARTPA